MVGVLICLASVCIEAQQFELTKHGEVKTLDYDSDWYVVQKLGNEDECCHSSRYFGKIAELTQDSMRLTVEQFETRKRDDDRSYLSKVKYNPQKEFPIYTIAKSDIKNIQEKGSRLKEVFVISGGILLVASVATAIHLLIVDGDDRKALLASAGIQLGTSILLISIGNSKKDKYIIHENVWQF